MSDYFCNVCGNDIESEHAPDICVMCGAIMCDICHGNENFYICYDCEIGINPCENCHYEGSTECACCEHY